MQANLIALLQGPNPHAVVLVKIVLPGGTVRLSSALQITYGGETYIPRDPYYGMLSFVAQVVSGQTGRATSPDVGLEVANDDAIAELTSPAAKHSPITVWWGAVDPVTGAVEIDDEDGPLSVMRLDTVDVSHSPGRRSLLIKTYPPSALQLRPSARQRLNPSFHKSVWPGETGLDNVTGIVDEDGWRTDDPPLRQATGGITNPGPRTGGGGGYGGGSFNRV